MKSIRLLGVIMWISIQAYGQFVDYGADPSRLRWKMVKTPHYQIIYPTTIDSMAYRYAFFLEKAYPAIGKTIGERAFRKFPVMLHPGNMLSNGMVAWAPRRMELIATPQANLGPQSWDKHLVMHESRHVFQMYKFAQGVFKPFYYLLGEQMAGVSSFAVPKWFLEGDAVGIETAMSNSGRGRLPEFDMTYRAQMFSGKRFFSYDKWALGSYKDYSGDYYALGYLLTSYARHQYGEDVWDKVTTRYTRRFFRIPPFSKALKHYTGLSTRKLFDETFQFLKMEWALQDSLYELSGFKDAFHYITPQTKRFSAYRYPQVLDDSVVIAVKTSLDNISSLVSVKDGKEERLCYLGAINSPIVVNQGHVYWTEYVAGRRWTHENFSELKYYELATGKRTTVTRHGRLLAPAIDGAGSVAVLSLPSVSGNNQVVMLDIASGEETNHYPVPSNGFVKEMVFTSADRVAALVINDDGLCILQLHLTSGTWDELLPPTNANIASLTARDDRLYFESGLNGTNNIYCLDLTTCATHQLTTSRFGAFFPAFSNDGKQMIFSDYDASGYRIAAISIDSLQEQPADFGRPYLTTLAESISQQEAFNIDAIPLEAMEYDSKPYPKTGRLFRIHSWAPVYYNVYDLIGAIGDDLRTIVKPGCMFLSQNLLSTMMTQVGWYYDKGYHHGKIALSYSGWFPVIDLSVDYGGQPLDFRWYKDEENKDAFYYDSPNHPLLTAEARIYLPFNFTDNHYISGFQPTLSYFYTNNGFQELNSGRISHYQYMIGELRYYRYRKLAYQDILPRWGYQIRLQHLQTPNSKENFGSLYAAGLTTYLPGLVRGHGLMLRMQYQYQDLSGKTFYNPQQIISQARGYAYIIQSRQQVALKADYAFSLFSPDWSVGGLAYFKRVRANLFYDFTINQEHKQSGWAYQRSLGGDLIVDSNIFRLSYPISFGIRVIKPLDYGRVQTETMMSVAF